MNITTNDLEKFEDIYFNFLVEICPKYFHAHGYEWEDYGGFEIEKGGNILIHYIFTNYHDEYDSDFIKVSYKQLVDFANNINF